MNTVAKAIADKYISANGGKPEQLPAVTEQERAWLLKGMSRNGYMPTWFRDGDYAPSLEQLRKMEARNLVSGPPWRVTLFGRDVLTGRPTERQGRGAAIRPLREVERDAILSAIRQCSYNKTHAAKALGISLRTVRNKLREYERNEAATTAPAKSTVRIIPA